MESIAITVPRKKAEQIRKKLAEKGALRTDLQIDSDSKNVYFPVSQHLDLGYEITTRSFKEQKQIVSDYREMLDIPEDLRFFLPSSFDVIGHVAIIKIPDELEEYSKDIAKAILKVSKPIKTVCLDEGVKGETRTRDLKILAGDKDTMTVYKEHGLTFKVDPRTMFFSPRLATERKIVADQVAEGESIFDMFAGVGPFSILIAKTRSPKVVYAADINENAFQLLNENIRTNKVEEIVKPLLGDARDVAPDVPKVSRIIMNLPHSAFEFLDLAAGRLMENGVLHFYDILESSQLESRTEEIDKRLGVFHRNIDEIRTRIVKSYSPSMRYYAMDMVIE